MDGFERGFRDRSSAMLRLLCEKSRCWGTCGVDQPDLVRSLVHLGVSSIRHQVWLPPTARWSTPARNCAYWSLNRASPPANRHVAKVFRSPIDPVISVKETDVPPRCRAGLRKVSTTSPSCQGRP